MIAGGPRKLGRKFRGFANPKFSLGRNVAPDLQYLNLAPEKRILMTNSRSKRIRKLISIMKNETVNNPKSEANLISRFDPEYGKFKTPSIPAHLIRKYSSGIHKAAMKTG